MNLLSKFLLIAKSCYEQRNFATAMQILGGLEHAAVRQCAVRAPHGWAGGPHGARGFTCAFTLGLENSAREDSGGDGGAESCGGTGVRELPGARVPPGAAVDRWQDGLPGRLPYGPPGPGTASPSPGQRRQGQALQEPCLPTVPRGSDSRWGCRCLKPTSSWLPLERRSARTQPLAGGPRCQGQPASSPGPALPVAGLPCVLG